MGMKIASHLGKRTTENVLPLCVMQISFARTVKLSQYGADSLASKRPHVVYSGRLIQ